MADSPRRRDVVSRVATEIARRREGLGHALRVGIDGRSTAGKTYLADELGEVLRAVGIAVVRVSIDHFHRPGHKYRSERGEWTPETRLAEGLDYEAFRRLVLEPLGTGGNGRCRVRLWDSFNDIAYAEEWAVAGPGDVLVCDAGFGFVPEIVAEWDYRIWLEVSAETMVARATGRDIAWAGTPDDVRHRYEQRWVPTDALYQNRHRPRDAADCVIDNTEFEAPVVIRMG